jgi:hypothetical protein
MKKLIFIAIFTLLTILSSYSFAHLVSPMPSTVEALDLPNAHIVYENFLTEGALVRGMAPIKDYQKEQLLEFGVDEILIFKNDTRGEVAEEVREFKRMGVRDDQIHQIPFPWKDHDSFTNTCEMTVKALMLMEEAESKGKTLFFHCTVGEDRTGYLAGLFLIWKNYEMIEDIFESEMCQRGYGAGNPFKPYSRVVKKIRDSLTPRFSQMAYLLKKTKKAAKPLSLNVCSWHPRKSRNYYKKDFERFEELTCKKSSLLDE